MNCSSLYQMHEAANLMLDLNWDEVGGKGGEDRVVRQVQFATEIV